MTDGDIFQQKNSVSRYNGAAYRVLATVVGLAGIFIAIGLLFPHAISILLNTIWVILMAIVFVFFALGVLVVIGLRKEASRILEILMEGSLSLVDFVAFLKLLWLRFLEILRDFILYVTPLVGYVVALILYVLILILYKKYGKDHDITLFTIILTAVLVFFMGILTKPSKKIIDLTKWWTKVQKAFHSSFIDGLEVVLFIFFLTMDSTNLFFLPPELNIPLEARYKNFDFMVKSFKNDGNLRVTLNIIVVAITIEVARNVLKIAALARKHYINDLLLFSDGLIASRATRIKSAIRKSFSDSKDDLIRFITYTTILFAVFLAFPRLKLLTLTVASFTGICLDLIILDRLFMPRGTDLISRIISKLFKV